MYPDKTMKIVQINDNDLNGRIYNGHDLQISLNNRGIEAHQLVMEKYGDVDTTIPLLSEHEVAIRRQLTEFENKTAMLNLLEPFSDKLLSSQYFQEADVVHYHIIHNRVISLYDIPKLMNLHPSVWTIHDPWLVGGHCIYPLECDKWKTGCIECPDIKRPFSMELNKAHEIWQIKKTMFTKLDTDIVVSSDWMRRYITNSPLTGHLTRIHKIPFGLMVEKYENGNKDKIRHKMGISKNNIVISFRAEEHIVKGLKYIVEALEKLIVDEPVTIITIGTAKLPISITERYQTIELGWQREPEVINCLLASDIFLMPSIAESFGLMAIEAMAAKCAVVVFENTVLEQVTFAPRCGVSVALKDAEALKAAIKHLIENQEELRYRSETGLALVREHYAYNDYVQKHIDLYREVAERKKKTSLHENGTFVISELNKEEQYTINGMSEIAMFKSKVKAISYNKANKICIYGAGAYGRKLYFDLKDRMILVDYLVDSDESKWGYLLLGNGSKNMMEAGVEEYVTREVDSSPMSALAECVGLHQLLKDKEDILVIVANKNPDNIVKDLKKMGIPYLTTKQEMDEIMKMIPRTNIFGLGEFHGEKLKELVNLRYTDEGTHRLITSFNRIISGVCQYYEEKLSE